jgi:DNA (cytosine-5)-methyltransferase 3A
LGVKVSRTYTSEIFPPALLHETHHFPKNIKLGSVTDIDFRQLKEDIKRDFKNPIILLVGGSPCQNFSFAGTRKGMTTKTKEQIETLDRYLELKDEGVEFEGQSYLFWEFIRAKEELSPDYFLLENVKMNKKNKEILNRAIGCEPVLINSSLVSAQSRERLYWFNWTIEGLEDRGVELKDIIDESEPFRPLGRWVYSNWGNKRKLDSLKTIYAPKSSCLTTNKTHFRNYYLNESRDKYRNLSIKEWERLQTFPSGYVVGLVDEGAVSATSAYKLIGNSWTLEVIKHILKGLIRKRKTH